MCAAQILAPGDNLVSSGSLKDTESEFIGEHRLLETCDVERAKSSSSCSSCVQETPSERELRLLEVYDQETVKTKSVDASHHRSNLQTPQLSRSKPPGVTRRIHEPL